MQSHSDRQQLILNMDCAVYTVGFTSEIINKW